MNKIFLHGLMMIAVISSGPAHALSADALFSSAGASATAISAGAQEVGINAANQVGRQLGGMAGGLLGQFGGNGGGGVVPTSDGDSPLSSLSPNGQQNCGIYNQAREKALRNRINEITPAGSPAQAMQEMGVYDLLNKKINIMGGDFSGLLDGFNMESLITAGKLIANDYATKKISSTLSNLGLPIESAGKIAATELSTKVFDAGTGWQNTNVPAPTPTSTSAALKLIHPTGVPGRIDANNLDRGIRTTSLSYSVTSSGGRLYSAIMTDGSTQVWLDNGAGTLSKQ